LSALVMMVWLLGLRTPELTGFGQVIAAMVGVVMLVLGLGSVRLSGAVRRRERAALAGAAAAERAEKRAAKTKAEERVTPPPRPLSSDPVAPANPRWDSEPVVGEAIPRPAAPAPSATAFDPATGHAIDPATGRSLDPATGRAFDPVSGHKIDPETGRAIDPVTGRTVDPVTGQFIDPVRRDPH
jgi:YHS domain-containing protein